MVTMAFSTAIFILILKVNFITSFFLLDDEFNKTFWPAEYSDKNKINDFETERTSEWTSDFHKIRVQNEHGPLFLTPYVENGYTEKAKNLSAVDPTFFAGIQSYSGYFTVNKTNKWHLFFWYFPAEGVDLGSTPLIVWLQGGPGCSSLYGLFEEIGPIRVINGSVERMPITWGSNYSLLFIDNPVGTGFSFTEDPHKYVTDEDMVGACLLSFIQQFLQVFPELTSAPLFIAGESYGGKYIPAFGHYIHHYRNDSMPINLKGLAIGNGWTDPPTLLHYSEFALQIGLLDPEQAEEIHKLEEKARKAWEAHDMTEFAAYADGAFMTLHRYMQSIDVYNYVMDKSKKIPQYKYLMNKPEIQGILHTKREQYVWFNMKVYYSLYDDIYETVKPWLEELVEHYGVMCYSGQLDVRVPYANSVHTYRSLNWTRHQDYLQAPRKPIYDEDDRNKINSFVKASGNFMDVMVRNAGHMVPADQARAGKQIIDIFINKFK